MVVPFEAGTRPSSWDELPDEILLQVLSFLDPYSITRLQLVSRKLQELCLDDELWRRHCFDNSSWYASLLRRRRQDRNTAGSHSLDDNVTGLELQEKGDNDLDGDNRAAYISQDRLDPWHPLSQKSQRLQDLANWDPVFPGEQVSWYDEYIHRNGPTSVNWFESPLVKDTDAQAFIEARGLALYNPYDGNDGQETMLAVAPLDDGSVCLWDVKGSRSRPGRIIAKSDPDILFIDGPGEQNSQRSKRVATGVTDCVSVYNNGHRAFFAVQSHLIEVDLNRLQVVSRESFEWSITTLSPANEGVPLTVGTTLGVHLHDFRTRASPRHDVVEKVDSPPWDGTDIFKAIFDSKPLSPYAALSQPTPINVLHLPRSGSHTQVSDDIYVSGRFSNILHYDRRKFPAIVDSIYSGALIRSMAALPYPFSTMGNEVRRGGEMTSEQVTQMKESGEGWTLIAGGDYNNKGSLEIYGLSTPDPTSSAVLQNSTLKNRQTIASSAILSVANHGTKIAFSDGSGLIKWFERDGTTECRQLRIGHSETEATESLFSSMPATDDLARKILSTKSQQEHYRPCSDNILFWTGEKLGMVSFTTAPIFTSAEDESDAQSIESAAEDEARQRYSQQMRKALERQADEVRFVNGLGLAQPPT